MKLIGSIYLLTVGILTTCFCYVLVLSAKLWGQISKSSRTNHHIHGIASLWGKTIFRFIPGWRVTLEGLENLPPEGKGCVYVANHESATDIFILYFLPTQFRWIAKDATFRLPMVGQAMRWAGYVSISRGVKDSHRLALQRSAECVQSGVPMLFFPQGTRSLTGEVKDFKVGAFKLALDTKVPIVPIVLHGAGKLLRKSSFSPGRAHVLVKVLPGTTVQAEEGVEAFTLRVQTLIAQHHADLKRRYGEASTAPIQREAMSVSLN